MGNQSVKQVDGYRYPSGNVYSGQMSGRKRHGQGTLRWPDGATYTGQWVQDLCQGMGKMTFPNKSTFEGTWVRNNPHGGGVLTTINQEQLNGQWTHMGRSDMTLTAAAKYSFSGFLIDLKTGIQRSYNGPLALYLQSGLVSMPNMDDPMLAMLPYAQALPVASSPAAGGKSDVYDLKDDKYDVKTAVPIAEAVQTAPSSSSSIAYGQFEIALQQRHVHDHAAVNLADPRAFLSGLGVPVYAPNSNRQQQAEMHTQYEAAYGQSVARNY